jgi:hypothetical protein
VPPPGGALLLLVTGKTFGAEVSQVTELVTSLTVGAVENVPIARNCPLSFKAPKTIPLGMMVSERMLPPLPPAVPPAVLATVMIALEVVWPLNASAPAVTVVVPAPTAVTSPALSTVATAGVFELQVAVLVIFCVEGCFALPNVPMAVSCAVCPVLIV